MKFTAQTIAILSSALIFVGFFPSLHPAFDSLALARPIFGLFCLIGILGAGRWSVRIVYAAIASFALIQSLIHVGSVTPDGALRVYSKNMLYHNAQSADIAADILSSDADIVMLQELSQHNIAILDAAKPAFPHHYVCQRNKTLSLAVLSKHPMTGDTVCSKRGGVAAARLTWENRDVWAVSAHIRWHWPINSRPGENEALAILGNLDGPVIVAGDFNSLPWSDRMQRFSDVTQTTLAGPMVMTLKRSPIPPLPIDHVLAPAGGTVTQRPLFGSDHHGILADVRLKSPGRATRSHAAVH